MRGWVVVGACTFAALELFLACSNDSRDGMPDGSSSDGSVTEGASDASSDADASPTIDGEDESTLSMCDASTDDPRNCGRCQHDCVGGTCAAGVCQSWTVLDTPAS